MRILNIFLLVLTLPIFLFTNINISVSASADYVDFKFDQKDFRLTYLSESTTHDLTGINKYHTEFPPRVIEVVKKNKVFYKYFAITHRTASCHSSTNILSDTVKFSSSNCKIVSKSKSKQDWKRNYYGLYDFIVTTNQLRNKQNIIAVTHGENKNKGNKNNTINKNVKSKKCTSGFVNNIFRECWDAYNAFVGIAHSNYLKKNANFKDLGPILWPSTGYLDAEKNKVSYGLRHPDLIEHNGYVYVFYLEGTQIQPGKNAGIKVARAPIPKDGIPKPGTFKNYANGGFTEDSLPKGFKKSKIKKFYATKGGKADKILKYDYDASSIMFSVAKVKNTDYFVGIEELQDHKNKRLVVGLRFSKDLVNWSKLTEIHGSNSLVWADFTMHYPTFLNKANLSSNKIGLSEFHIQYTNPKAVPSKMKLRIEEIK